MLGAVAGDADPTDPARNQALPCDAIPAANTPARAQRNIVHVANRCGFVGTDVELQSRTDAAGKVRDYAFVGTMGEGFKIWDVIDPWQPTQAGGCRDPGWQNDIQVRGNVAVSTFDGVSGEPSSASTCLKTKYPTGKDQGVDIYRLEYDRATGDFHVALEDCLANPPGGAHNSTLHPAGQWLAISNPSSDWAVDVVDLRSFSTSGPVLRYRFIDGSRDTADRCPPPEWPNAKCVVMRTPSGAETNGEWRPHDVHFSADGKRMYVAAINSTFVVDSSKALSGQLRTLSIIPNVSEPAGGDPSRNISISHQSDVTPDGKILVIGDEKGGGLQETGCHTGENGLQGGLHFWALAPISGVASTRNASHTNPKTLGVYFNPNPEALPVDPVGGSLLRGCTVHVFRIGGNGTASPARSPPATTGSRGSRTASSSPAGTGPASGT
ncbi:MAG TPA: hypothetical protein VHK22_01175 [Gaiellaceae bacterium]|nr:hypothetical protein [Gaiellaceae bacterium]